MFDSVKTRAQRAKEFAEQHQTAVACALTAAVAVVVTRKIDIRVASNLLYNAGRENGVLALQNVVLMKFIDSKGLQDEFLQFIPDLMA